MENNQWQEEAEEIEARDDSAQFKGRNPLVEEETALGHRVEGLPKDSFTASAESQKMDEVGYDVSAEEQIKATGQPVADES